MNKSNVFFGLKIKLNMKISIKISFTINMNDYEIYSENVRLATTKHNFLEDKIKIRESFHPKQTICFTLPI